VPERRPWSPVLVVVCFRSLRVYDRHRECIRIARCRQRPVSAQSVDRQVRPSSPSHFPILCWTCPLFTTPPRRWAAVRGNGAEIDCRLKYTPCVIHSHSHAFNNVEYILLSMQLLSTIHTYMVTDDSNLRLIEVDANQTHDEEPRVITTRPSCFQTFPTLRRSRTRIACFILQRVSMVASDEDGDSSTRASKRQAQRACDACRRRKSVFKLVYY
jgi:hypothetical protein